MCAYNQLVRYASCVIVILMAEHENGSGGRRETLGYFPLYSWGKRDRISGRFPDK